VRVLDLFSGIGGFSLGLERAGMHTVAFCEVDPFCRAVLRKHWPNVPIYDDIRSFHPPRRAADLVCGGPPCQPNSSAARGRCKGTEDDRYLWGEALRVVAAVKPRWVVFENVVNFDRVGLASVVSDLEGYGYEVVPPIEIPACAVGHDHHRPRLWICGHADRDGEPGLPIDAEVARLSRGDRDGDRVGETDGLPGRLDRLRLAALGNSVVPQIPEAIGRAIMQLELSR
jgi:DNA (cytosine-5)-methyltransferase 1